MPDDDKDKTKEEAIENQAQQTTRSRSRVKAIQFLLEAKERYHISDE